MEKPLPNVKGNLIGVNSGRVDRGGDLEAPKRRFESTPLLSLMVENKVVRPARFERATFRSGV
jgi:hypothetical protein